MYHYSVCTCSTEPTLSLYNIVGLGTVGKGVLLSSHFLYLYMQNPNPESVSVGRNSKTSIIRKKQDTVKIAYDNGGKHTKPWFWGRRAGYKCLRTLYIIIRRVRIFRINNHPEAPDNPEKSKYNKNNLGQWG